jgi:exosortase
LTESSSTISAEGISRTQIAVIGIALVALWFVLCRQLSGEWSVNEQYSYGWFVPFFALFLFWLRWDDRPEVDHRGQRSEIRGRKRIAIGIGIGALLLLLPIRLFEIANPDWRPLGWVHTAVVVTITGLVLWSAGGKAWVRHFAFPVAFFFVAVPWISPIEEPIVQGLMRTVAAVATEAITLCGIPAQLEGNLIRVSTGLVGVNEACSGVRSLQTSIMIGLLFGELKRLSVPKRFALIFGALAIAIIANFARAFFLVWIAATQSISAVDRWHDFAGYTIVAAVFCGSLALAAILNRNQKVGSRKEEGGNEESGAPRFILHTSYFLIGFLWLLAVEIGVEAWYRIHERGLIAREQWTARWPEAAREFREVPIDDNARKILRFDQGRGARWRLAGGDAGDAAAPRPLDSALLYFFRWRAGSNSALLANLHRPDVCLPAAGWVQVGDYGIRSYAVSPKMSLPFRHFLFAQGTPTLGGNSNPSRQRFAHAFYCLREDRVRNKSEESAGDSEQFAQAPSEWSRRERIELVLQGRRHLGQQVMEFVLLTPNDMKAQEAETKFAALVPEMVEEK